MGLERIILLLKETAAKQVLDIYLAVTSQELFDKAFMIMSQLRDKGLKVDSDFCSKSLKGQLRAAQKKGARYVAIVGDDEISQESVMLKCMEDGAQTKIKISDLERKIKE